MSSCNAGTTALYVAARTSAEEQAYVTPGRNRNYEAGDGSGL